MADSTDRYPVEAKVKASARGAGAAGAVAGFVLWLLARYVFHAPVPSEVGALVFIVVPWALAAGTAWLGGYMAPHTPRYATKGPPSSHTGSNRQAGPAGP